MLFVYDPARCINPVEFVIFDRAVGNSELRGNVGLSRVPPYPHALIGNVVTQSGYEALVNGAICRRDGYADSPKVFDLNRVGYAARLMKEQHLFRSFTSI